MDEQWEFWIDVGGTFTDCVARSPQDELIQVKTLSSGVTKGGIDACPAAKAIRDARRRGDPPSFWTGYPFRLLDTAGTVVFETLVTAFETTTGTLQLADPLPKSSATPGLAYELHSPESAPILCIRRVLGLPLDASLPRISVRLGTTRGTNALLTRRGARTGLITTRGFADVLLIANQDRPRLFDLAIEKPSPLFETVVEVDERLDADGKVLRRPNANAIREQLHALRARGVQSLAICLLHAFSNDSHERLIEQIARDVGFTEVSRSSRLAPLIKIVSRGDTTVMDAYLNPILREYIGALQQALEPSQPAQAQRDRDRSQLRLMTSAGGLVDARHFVGKDSILSGPAGGVIGFSRAAQQAGFDKSIGFDMGGTSTDVSRFDGRYELEFETRKAGVRVVAPMLAIETVAAGGGSICGFDGVKLHVGPDSAGADPGPACYGRGGPLTVTDLNLFLGRLVPERFPFPLDAHAVAQRLQDLCEQIAGSPMGRRYAPAELAEGFLEIANANMVRAIRNISVARGYDPADYVLVTFGGAGAQHACAIAESLGIPRILLHPYAGILSAYGMGLADVRRFRERSVLKPYAPDTLAELDRVFEELAAEAASEVRGEGVPEAQIQPPHRSLDMRYLGAETTINVPCPNDGDFAAEYQRLHEQLYGYTHTGRDMEVTAARVEVVGRLTDPPVTRHELRVADAVAEAHRTARFHGKDYQTAVLFREKLHAGHRIAGPAIICEETSTVLVEPGFVAEITEQNCILMQRAASPDEAPRPAASTARAPQAPLTADPVTLEIFNNLFASIAEQMGITLQQTSFSTNVKERLDFSCAVFSPEGNLVVNAPHIPVHLGAMSETVKRILADNPDLAPGDVYVTNDPYRGGSHLPDVTVVTPVHDAQTAELLFFTASRAHHAEIGGKVPGSMPPFSRNLSEEGVLIRNFKLVDRGVSNEDALRELLSAGPYPSRSVSDNLADVSAQVAANNKGVRQLLELVERYSLPVVQAYMNFIQQAAEEKMRRALRRIADSDYRFTDHLDDGTPICVTVAVSGDTAAVDFTGTGPVLDSNLNANRAITTAAALYVFRCLIDEDIPLNSGVLAPVSLTIPECLLNPPEQADPTQSAAVVGGNVETSQRIVDTLLGALELAAASQGTMNNLTFGNERFGYYETICGGAGATPTADGADAVHTHMTNTRLTDVEIIERRYPVRIVEFAIRRNSGGMGRRRGGDGILRRIEFLEPLQVSMLSERRGRYRPYGMAGGEPGEPGRNRVLRAGSSQTDMASAEDLGGKFAIAVEPGDQLLIETPGGGGYGAR